MILGMHSSDIWPAGRGHRDWEKVEGPNVRTLGEDKRPDVGKAINENKLTVSAVEFGWQSGWCLLQRSMQIMV